MAADIRRIAEKAGVSISTVSRVFNKSKPVSEALRRRVLSIIEDENFVPNPTARSMVSRRTERVGVILPNISAFFHAQAVAGLSEELSRAGYHLLVANIGGSLENEARDIELFSRGIADGIILMHETHSARILRLLASMRLPLVLASVEIEGLDRPSVGIDDFGAAYEATCYLISLGHRSIGLIAGTDLTVGSYRTRGYRQALADSALPAEKRLQVRGDYSLRSGYEAAGQLLADNPDLTAIFAMSDEMAMGALRCLRDRGRRVPEDVSVMGFDDIEMAGYTEPPLSTVRQPISEIGRRSARMMLDILQGGERPAQRAVLPTEIVVRQSCAPPRRRRR